MNTFISGGCKNGKSYYAQRIAQKDSIEKNRPLYYIATMIPHDGEDMARIRRHLKEREGWGFETIEQGKDIMEICDRQEVDLGGTFLLDSVTAIMENEMFIRKENPHSGQLEIVYSERAAGKVRDDMVAFGRAVAQAGGSVVFVSDGIYGDMGGYSESTEEYRRALAAADRALAKACDRVIEIAYGTEEVWK